MNPRLRWMQQNAWLAGIDLETERIQAEQEGRNLAPLAAKFKKLLAVACDARDEAWFETAGRLIDQVQELPCDGREPSDLDGIRAARPRRVALKPWRGNRAEFIRRLHGGWLGRICGCLWGIKHGVDALPKKWTRPMRDLVRTGVAGYYEASISKLAEEMVDVALKAAPSRSR